MSKTVIEFLKNIDIVDFSKKYNDWLISELSEPVAELARKGWTIPAFINWLGITSYEPLKNDQNRLIESWENSYNQNAESLFEDILNDCPEQWKDLMQECISCYHAGKYVICIPALLVIFEGLLSIKIYNFDIDKTHYRDPMMNGIRSNHYAGIDTLKMLSIKEYVSNVFKKSTFSGTAPNNLNRHWIMHGRGCISSNKLEALQLFNAVGTLLTVNTLWADIVLK
ncbi:hypothetical protein CBX98_24600 [Vibrio sp. T9]|uniref:hypothetical protein n=1 Tax=Vibrio sp. T9 TaxID=2007196 RepID=UPI000D65C023|nr:hypothetical protein [Vibrio sp. T9]PWF67203.1 hypothetical protein CBX98_24600 [Vibrio sp. T9]